MPDLGKSGMVRMAFSISAAVGGDWIMVRFGNLRSRFKTDALFGRFARQSSTANRNLIMRGQAAPALSEEEKLCHAELEIRAGALRPGGRGGWLPGATRTFQRLPGPTEPKYQIPKSKSQTNPKRKNGPN